MYNGNWRSNKQERKMRTCENFGNIINENVIVQDSLQGVSV